MAKSKRSIKRRLKLRKKTRKFSTQSKKENGLEKYNNGSYTKTDGEGNTLLFSKNHKLIKYL